MKTLLRVLMVEDVVDDAIILDREILRGNYELTSLHVDTIGALRRALDETPWDLVLSDYSLPSCTALDVLHAIDASGHDIPCIIISGSIDEDAAVEALRSGARDFIVKDRLARLLPAIARELQEAAEHRKRRAAEAALAQATDRTRFALEAAGVGTWESDIVSGKTIWSDVMERLHGRVAGNFAGTFDAFIDAIHPDDRRGVLDLISQAVRNHTDVRLQYRVAWSDGSIHWMAGVGRTFYDNAGRAIRSAGVGLDITDQKALEEQVRQSQRIESLGRLTGGIAHDFNNLLTAILGYSNVLLDDLTAHRTPDDLAGDLEEIRKAGERAAALTSQLLAFSRKQIAQPTVLSLNTVVSNLEPMLNRVIGEDVVLVAQLAAALASVRADAGQIEQVIMNLVVNARDAMPDGGKVTIETASVDLDAAYAKTHITVVPGPYVMLAVSDTGVGMSLEVQAKVFEPFFTTKPKGRGTGLGLATVYGIVKQNGGYVWIYSEPGKGTTIKVYFPQVSEPPDVVAPDTRPAARAGVETVLLVEDDPNVLTLAKLLLTRNGYTVVEATSGEEALRVAAEYVGPIHLLLTDVVMPGINGRLLAQRLSEQLPDLRILYMSGYTSDAIVRHGFLKHGVAFLQKPFTPTTLARAVRGVLDA